MTQRGLFDEPEDKARTIQERFEKFHAEHPDVYQLFKRFAFELLDAGRKRYGSDAIIQRIRWHMATSSQGSPDFKINDHFSSRYARKLIEDCPQFADFFELRRLHSP
jgi:hypothetical protein